MAHTYTDVERVARALSADERSRLIDVLLDSLREGELAEIESAWAVEIDRRVRTYERGEAKLVPAADVFARARLITGS